MVGAGAIIVSGFFVGDEIFTACTIPAFVCAFVEEPGLFQFLPDILNSTFVVSICRADKISAFDVQGANKCLEIAVHLVDIFLRLEIVFDGFCGNLVAVLINARLETYVAAILLLVP